MVTSLAYTSTLKGRQYIPFQRWENSTRLHGVTFQKRVRHRREDIISQHIQQNWVIIDWHGMKRHGTMFLLRWRRYMLYQMQSFISFTPHWLHVHLVQIQMYSSTENGTMDISSHNQKLFFFVFFFIFSWLFKDALSTENIELRFYKTKSKTIPVTGREGP
jgi:hypothetical protein